ncbi:MAG: hypothetical protein QNL62_16560 [Gammaproteobacteria bacterium]|nr:hypothetical protein [Gammaproteobacteria bacterium]
MSRVVGMPVYEQQKVEVAARLYNLWRRAKLHMQCPIRFALADYRGLVMILDKDEWLCADERQNDMPVICWLKFADQGRDALHLPVQCTLNYYHFAASKIRAHVLELMAEELERMLSKKNNFKD